ncbi:hypothetical protein ACFFX0_25310 [Citricoccus parietis]|uniref:Uncharacterized protein n=1 Tax=Citricoccus parietis TaxID=592307 RepID=A0ABV5G5Y9_9MICC
MHCATRDTPTSSPTPWPSSPNHVLLHHSAFRTSPTPSQASSAPSRSYPSIAPSTTADRSTGRLFRPTPGRPT